MKDHDDVANPLTGVDLRAWQPPAPPPAPVGEVLARFDRELDGTGVETLMPIDVPPRRPVDMRLVAIGVVLGAIAAALVTIVIMRRDDPAPASAPPEQVRSVSPRPAPPRPGGTARFDFAKQLAACKDLQAQEEWFDLERCADEILAHDSQNRDGEGLKDQAIRESENKLHLADLEQAVKRKDVQGVVETFRKISPDSIYKERAQRMHDEARRVFVEEQLTWALARARSHDCQSIDTRAAQVGKIWPEAEAALKRVDCSVGECRVSTDCDGFYVCQRRQCVAPRQDSRDAAPCDADALLDEAKTAFGNNQWSKVLASAEAANRCKPNRLARQMYTRGACRMQNKAKAAKFWKEFQGDQQMRQACVGVMP